MISTITVSTIFSGCVAQAVTNMRLVTSAEFINLLLSMMSPVWLRFILLVWINNAIEQLNGWFITLGFT